MPRCNFNDPWVGYCDKEAPLGGYCSTHSKQTCWKCGEQAIDSCDYCYAQGVCGVNQCGPHRHYPQHVEDNKASICKRQGDDIAKEAFQEIWNGGTLMAGCSDSEVFNTPNGAGYTLTLRRDK